MGGRLITHPAAGLTLIELLVVIAILATLSLGTVLALRPQATGQDPATLATLWERQRTLAMTGHDRRALALSPRGVQALYWRNGEWVTTGDTAQWQNRASLRINAQGRAGGPEVVFLPDGRSTPFDITWTSAGSCRSTGGATLVCDN